MTGISDNDLMRLLSGDLEDKDRQAILSSLDSEEGQRIMSEQMDIVFNRLEHEDTNALNSQGRTQVKNRIESHMRRKIWWRRTAYVASLAAMFGLGWICTADKSNSQKPAYNEYNEIVVQKGERPLHMLFQDGTHVIVNAGSSLRYPLCFADNKRRVTLSGEAYFHVCPNSSSPFVVNMDESEIVVTGTAFNVRRFEGDSLTVITLDDGSLNLCCGNKEFCLKPSQKVIYNHLTNQGTIQSTGLSAARSSLWKDNIIAFDNTPMSEVLNTINRIYNVEFNIKDRSILAHSFTFTSAYIPLDSLLNDISAISFVSFSHDGDHIDVYSSR